MIVEVRLFADFRKGRFNEKALELPEASTVKTLLANLEIEEKDAKIIIVNGLAARGAQPLHDGDVIAIFPPIAGG